MAFVVFVLVVLAIGWAVWKQRARRGQAKPAGSLTALVDQGRDLLAPLYPSPPSSRRALPRRLLRAAEQTITIGVSGTVLVPTRIEIAVNPADLEPFADAMEWLRRDVAEALRQRARENGWVVPDGPEVVINADEERPVRIPRAIGRITAFSSEDVRTRRQPGLGPDRTRTPTPTPTPDRAWSPEATGATSLVDDPEPTVPAGPTVHVRLLSMDEPHSDGSADLNALLMAGTAPLVLGRSREADLHVDDHQVSARHCALALGPDEHAVHLSDLGSTNGTFVDGERIGEVALRPGSTLRIGRSSWRVEIAPVTA